MRDNSNPLPYSSDAGGVDIKFINNKDWDKE
jgi:hypothetical protein